MKTGTEKLLRCINCRISNFQVIKEVESHIEIRTGELKCLNCGSDFRIENGIVDFTNNLTEKVCCEINQWEIFADSEGWLNPADEYLDTLPSKQALKYVPCDTINWDRHEANFNLVLKDFELSGKKLLDIGAGRCWSTKHLTIRGAECYACDVLMHRKIGLGASDILMKRNGIYFERVGADMNNIPFIDECLDIVFISGSLHHSLNLKQSLSEFCRVLKKGGSLFLTNEPCSSFIVREVFQMDGNQKGINEHSYHTWRYLLYLWKLGFRYFEIFPSKEFIDQRYSDVSKYILSVVGKSKLLYLIYLLIRGGVIVMRAQKIR